MGLGMGAWKGNRAVTKIITLGFTGHLKMSSM